jgi:hypothetical protein
MAFGLIMISLFWNNIANQPLIFYFHVYRGYRDRNLWRIWSSCL